MSTSRSRSAFEPLESRMLMSAGDLDPTFGGDGMASVSFPGATFEVSDAAVQADGKVVLVGAHGANSAVARLNADGTVDASFGAGGLFVFGVSGGPSLRKLAGVAVGDDGKIVVAGDDDKKFAVARFTPDGWLDPTFDSDGVVKTGITDGAWAMAVTVQKDGKVVAAGRREEMGFFTEWDWDFAVVRYNADGSRDTTFDSDGIVTVGFGYMEEANAVAVDYNGAADTNPYYGTIVAAGGGHFGEGNRFMAVRLLPNGQWDNGFDGDGAASIAFADRAAATGVVIQGGGRVVMAGPVGAQGARNLGLARLTAGGAPDASFGPLANGRAEVNLGGDEGAIDLAASDAGGLVAGTVTASGLAVACFTRDGLLDGRFSGDGVATAFFGDANAQVPAVGIAAGPGRQVVVAGARGRAARFEDLGQKVGFLSFDTEASESGPNTAAFLLIRDEPLPTPLQVYLSTGGTASPWRFRSAYDYTGFAPSLSIYGTGYVEIPAYQTFVSVIITPVDDTLVEGTEYASFSIVRTDAVDPNPVSPSLTVSIRDNDTWLTVVRAPITTTTLMLAGAPGAAAAEEDSSGHVAGDVTGDGIVTEPDLVAMKRRLDARGRTPAYSVFADVNADGVVNALDLAAVKRQLGRPIGAGALFA